MTRDGQLCARARAGAGAGAPCPGAVPRDIIIIIIMHEDVSTLHVDTVRTTRPPTRATLLVLVPYSIYLSELTYFTADPHVGLSIREALLDEVHAGDSKVRIYCTMVSETRNQKSKN